MLDENSKTYGGGGSFGVAESNADIPSLSSASVIAAVGALGDVHWLVGEVDLAGRVSLSGGNIGTTYRAQDLAGYGHDKRQESRSQIIHKSL